MTEGTTTVPLLEKGPEAAEVETGKRRLSTGEKAALIIIPIGLLIAVVVVVIVVVLSLGVPGSSSAYLSTSSSTHSSSIPVSSSSIPVSSSSIPVSSSSSVPVSSSSSSPVNSSSSSSAFNSSSSSSAFNSSSSSFPVNSSSSSSAFNSSSSSSAFNSSSSSSAFNSSSSSSAFNSSSSSSAFNSSSSSSAFNSSSSSSAFNSSSSSSAFNSSSSSSAFNSSSSSSAFNSSSSSSSSSNMSSSSSSSSGEKFISPMDELILHIGRWDTRNESAPAFAWSGSGFRFAVNGTKYARLNVHLNSSVVPIVGVKCFIDGVPQDILYINESATTINLDISDNETHVIQFSKLSEVQFGRVMFEGIIIEEAGELVDLEETTGKKKHVLEVVGDSLTCGFGDLGAFPCEFSLDTEDPTVAYGWRVAERLGAVPSLVSWSGIGVVCDFNGTTPGHEMPKAYPYLFGNITTDEPMYDFSNKPDAVMIFLGSNDDSCYNLNTTEFKEGYINFWNYLLNEAYQDLPSLQLIIGCGSAGGPYGDSCVGTRICRYVEEAVKEAQNPRVHFVHIFPYSTDKYCDERILGCASHPNVKGQEFMFESVVQRVADILNWTDTIDEMPTKNVTATWGRSGAQSNLSQYCTSNNFVDEYTMIMIDGVRKFGLNNSYSLLDINETFCNEHFDGDKPDLLKCDNVGADIKTCQDHKVKVLLTIGGYDCEPESYDLSNETQAIEFADELWDTYFGGDSSTRPFGDAVLDGINLDIQQGNGEEYYSFVVSELVNKSQEANKDFIVTITTKDCNLDQTSPLLNINSTTLIVRYISDECDIAKDAFGDNVKSWFEYASGIDSRVEVFVSSDSSHTKMLDIDNGLDSIKDEEMFDGVAFDAVEPSEQAPLTACVVNTIFKQKQN